jgi:hypothetical protein
MSLCKSPELTPVQAGLAARPSLTCYEVEIERIDKLLGSSFVDGVEGRTRNSSRNNKK